jgi:hypothetical protein
MNHSVTVTIGVSLRRIEERGGPSTNSGDRLAALRTTEESIKGVKGESVAKVLNWLRSGFSGFAD